MLTKHVFEFGPFQLDVLNHTLMHNHELVPLGPKVIDTLLILVQHPGQIVAKDELMKQLWPNEVVEENNLAQNVYVLRKALGEDPLRDSYIKTYPKQGYRFVAPVRELKEEEEGGKEREIAAPIAEQAPSTSPRWLRVGGIAVLALGLIALAFMTVRFWRTSYWSTPGTPPVVTAVAVLPFKVVSSNDDYFGLVMADALIARLSAVKRLTVRSTRAVSKYVDASQEPLTIGRELVVDAVLDGQIRRTGDRIQLTVRMLSAATGKTIWTKDFDEPLANISVVQDAISAHVVQMLSLEVSGAEKKLLTKHGTESLEAYPLYLKGRYFWNRRNSSSLATSIEYFQQAIALDPDYALAYVGLADTYAVRGMVEKGPPHLRASVRLAKAAAGKALELDNSLGEAHASAAFMKTYFDWDWVGAEREFNRAIELNPNHATAHHWYANYLTAMRRLDEALAEIKRAQQIDPVSPPINAAFSRILYCARQYDESIRQCQKTLELNPNFAAAQTVLVWDYEQKGMQAESVNELLKSMAPPYAQAEKVARLKDVYRSSGRDALLRGLLEVYLEKSRNDYFSPVDLAAVHTALNEKGLALEWLEKAYADRSTQLIFIKVEPRFDSLRSDPSFQSLLRRIGLDP